MATPIGFDPATWNSSVVEPFTLGQTVEYQGKYYRLFLNANGASDNAVADGDVLLAASATSETWCNALNGVGSALTNNPPKGVGIGAVSKNYYGFALVKGIHTNVKSTSTTAGFPQKISATAATCTDQSASTIRAIGVALTATSGGRCTVDVDL